MKRSRRRRSLSARVLGLLLLGAPPWASGELITVTTLHDVRDFGGAQRVDDLPGPDGRISFGEAVTAANNEPGPQTIHFAIPAAEYWLVSNVALLELELGPFVLSDDGTTVDFRTQTSFAGDTNPGGWEVGIYGLEPNGWGIAAILITGDGCTVIGLDDVYQRGYAVDISGSQNRVQSFTTRGPLHAAIRVQGSSVGPAAVANVIGGTGPGEGNVVSGGSYAIRIGPPSEGNVVIGNTCLESPHIGISVVGATTYGLVSRDNRVGGPTSAERNWVAGVGSYGEEGFPTGTQIEVNDADGTIVEGNYVGTTQNGLADYPLQRGPIGIEVRDSRDTLVRGTLVSGMLQVGLDHYLGQRFGTAFEIRGDCEDTRVVGNLVGTDASGEHPIPNVHGIVVDSFGYAPVRTQIGGTLAGEGNTIAFSENAGIRVGSRFGAQVGTVAIRGNRVFENGALGIDLLTFAGGGVTPNDPLDADAEGGNHLQNFPELRGAASIGSSLLVLGRLRSAPLEAYSIDFFASSERDPTGFGEGERYLGSVQVTADALGNAPFQASFRNFVPEGWFVTATATGLLQGETSEFSRGVPAQRIRRIQR